MTTGYDCPDLLNVCLMRPIFSPTDFIQIKGRGTRKHNFLEELLDKELAKNVFEPEKNNFKLFDFFANCEYFELKFNYDEILKLPVFSSKKKGVEQTYTTNDEFENIAADPIKKYQERAIGADGMKIDRMYFDRFEETVKDDKNLQKMIAQKDIEAIEKYILQNIFDKPEDYFNLEKLRNSVKIDRRLTLQEIIEKLCGFITYFKSKDEILEDEFEKFDSRYLPDEKYFFYAKNYFKSYIIDNEFRDIIENKKFPLLNTNPNGDVYRKLPPELRTLIPEYIKDNISLNQFMA